jgi:hypothetical protein
MIAPTRAGTSNVGSEGENGNCEQDTERGLLK